MRNENEELVPVFVMRFLVREICRDKRRKKCIHFAKMQRCKVIEKYRTCMNSLSKGNNVNVVA